MSECKCDPLAVLWLYDPCSSANSQLLIELTCQINFKTVFVRSKGLVKLSTRRKRKKKEKKSEILAAEWQHPGGGLEKLQHQLFGSAWQGRNGKCFAVRCEVRQSSIQGCWMIETQASQTVWSGVDHGFAETSKCQGCSVRSRWFSPVGRLGGRIRRRSLEKMSLDESGAQLISLSALNPLNPRLEFKILAPRNWLNSTFHARDVDGFLRVLNLHPNLDVLHRELKKKKKNTNESNWHS